MTSRFVTTLRVRFAETDQQGVVHHGATLTYFEVARVEYFRNLGFDYRRMEETGLSLVVVEAASRYHRPAYFDDELRLFIELTQLRSASLTFGYEVRRGEELLTSGTTKLAVLGPGGRPRRIPADFKEALLSGEGPPS
jgi:acyl-CoA thioester hydrolase